MENRDGVTKDTRCRSIMVLDWSTRSKVWEFRLKLVLIFKLLIIKSVTFVQWIGSDSELNRQFTPIIMIRVFHWHGESLLHIFCEVRYDLSNNHESLPPIKEKVNPNIHRLKDFEYQNMLPNLGFTTGTKSFHWIVKV